MYNDLRKQTGGCVADKECTKTLVVPAASYHGSYFSGNGVETLSLYRDGKLLNQVEVLCCFCSDSFRCREREIILRDPCWHIKRP